jgi:hypothetical protein
MSWSINWYAHNNRRSFAGNSADLDLATKHPGVVEKSWTQFGRDFAHDLNRLSIAASINGIFSCIERIDGLSTRHHKPFASHVRRRVDARVNAELNDDQTVAAGFEPTPRSHSGARPEASQPRVRTAHSASPSKPG